MSSETYASKKENKIKYDILKNVSSLCLMYFALSYLAQGLPFPDYNTWEEKEKGNDKILLKMFRLHVWMILHWDYLAPVSYTHLDVYKRQV